MERAGAPVLLWIGRLCILGAIFVLVASLFFPEAVQPLNPIICPEGTELDNGQYVPPNSPDNRNMELVCTSATFTQSAAKEVGLVVVGGIAFGLGCIYLSHRLRHPVTRVPTGPTIR